MVPLIRSTCQSEADRQCSSSRVDFVLVVRDGRHVPVSPVRRCAGPVAGYRN